jgi:hypothetical protein
LARAGISFSGQDLIPVRRYQLFADLEDSQSSRGGRSALVPVDHTPEWQPWGNIFGLAVGPEHSFSIPSPLFAPMEEFEGQLVFRFAPLAEGIIFSGSFKQEVRHEQKNVFERSEWFETVDVNLSYAEGMVILRYFAGDAWGEKNIFLLPGQTESIITVVLSFEVQENTLRFSLGLNAPVKFLPDEGILLSGPLTGEGTFRLGAAFGGTSMPVVPSVQSSAAEIFSSDWDIETSLIFGTETKPLSPAYILDEFIVSVVPNTSLNKRSEAVDVVSTSSSAEIPEDVSSGILPEDIPIEAAIDGNEEYRIEEISDEYEITGLPAISDGTTAIFY